MHPLDLLGFGLAVCNVNFAGGNGGAAIAGANRLSPAGRKLFSFELIDESHFAPRPIAPRPAPLRPIFGLSCRDDYPRRKQQERKTGDVAKFHGSISDLAPH